MDIRLITVKEDFEKAYNIFDQKEYPLSFYEYFLKHENYLGSKKGPKLIGVFEDEFCIGTLSYKLTRCPLLGKILEVTEIHQTNKKGYNILINFLENLALDENCHAVKICKNRAERMNQNIFDKLENFLKELLPSRENKNNPKMRCSANSTLRN